MSDLICMRNMDSIVNCCADTDINLIDLSYNIFVMRSRGA